MKKILSFCIIIFFITTAFAHPHCWVESKIVPQFNAEGIVGFQVEWLFDETTSAGIFDVYDEDGNKNFSPTEIDSIKIYTFSGMQNDDFYLRILANDIKKSIGNVEDLEITSNEWTIGYSFFVPCIIKKEDFDTVKITQADLTYFIDFTVLQEIPLIDSKGIPIEIRFFEDKENAFYFDQIYPVTLEISKQ